MISIMRVHINHDDKDWITRVQIGSIIMVKIQIGLIMVGGIDWTDHENKTSRDGEGTD